MAFILFNRGYNTIINVENYETEADRIFNDTPAGEHAITKMYVRAEGDKLVVDSNDDPE
jgi:hypothetical protein